MLAPQETPGAVMIPRAKRFSTSLIILCQLLGTSSLRGQAEIPFATADEAIKHIATKVEPITPPIAKLTKTGGPAVADIVIAADGSVESVNITSGAPLLSQAARDAIKQWKFDPFIEKGDQFFSKAVGTFEAATSSVPQMKDNYARRLKNTLLEYAEFKRAAGQNDAADALESKANRF
jgi:TonB family protein